MTPEFGPRSKLILRSLWLRAVKQGAVVHQNLDPLLWKVGQGNAALSLTAKYENTPENTPTPRKHAAPFESCIGWITAFWMIYLGFPNSTVTSDTPRKRTHLLRDEEVVGSNPATPTRKEKASSWLAFLFRGGVRAFPKGNPATPTLQTALPPPRRPFFIFWDMIGKS